MMKTLSGAGIFTPYYTLILLVTLFSCQKKADFSETVTSEENGKVKLMDFDPSGRLEVRIWSGYVDGSHNHAEVAVDPDFVLVGGGARVTNFSNDETGVNALLTSSYPKDDGNFNTWIAESKDHILSYNHRLWVFAIGMKLYDQNQQPLAASYVKSHMNISKATSGTSNRPATSINVPSGYNLLSGGAHIVYNAPGILLVQSWGNIPISPAISGWYVSGKDHTAPATGYIEAYALSFDNNIPEFGSLAFRSLYDQANYSDHMVTKSLSIDPNNEGWMLTGIGTVATYNSGEQGRLVFAQYPVDGKVGRVGTKDHVNSDLTGGGTPIFVIGIKKQ